MTDILNHHRARSLGIAFLGLWLASGALPAAAAGVYKWTDDKGVVHYSDQLPPDAVNKSTVLLDKQGRPLKKIEPAPTPEQQRAKDEEEERQKASAKVKEERARKDLALLQSYTNQEEIDIARGRALSAIEGQLKSAESYTADLRRRQQELEKQKAASAGKPLPTVLENELTALNEELPRQARLMVQKKDEVATINAKYDTDKRRWQEIKADPERSSLAAAAGLGATPAATPAKASTAKGPATATK